MLRRSPSKVLIWLLHHTFLMGRHFRRPTYRELLTCFIASTIIGIGLGLVIGMFAQFHVKADYPDESWFLRFKPLGRAVLQLVVFSTAFFLFCGIPGVTIVPWTLKMPPLLGRWVRGILYFIGGSLAMAVGLLLLPRITGIQFFSGRIMVFVIAFDGLITTILGAVIFSYEQLELEVRRRVKEIEEREREAVQMRRLADSAKLSALQAQINPHFFFNTLNSITALIPRDPSLAADTVERLADLFRYTMHSSEEVLVRFSDELKFVRDYLSIEKLRYGKRLMISEVIAPSSLSFQVPGLCLQPVVENAIKHGISSKPEGGTIRIETAVDNGLLRIQVRDNGKGITSDHPFEPGHALDNVRKRLSLLYGDEATLRVFWDPEGSETVIEFLIPEATKSRDQVESTHSR
ncbi:sensor histidine kinase [Acidobacteriota bacterium]